MDTITQKKEATQSVDTLQDLESEEMEILAITIKQN